MHVSGPADRRGNAYFWDGIFKSMARQRQMEEAEEEDDEQQLPFWA